MTRMNAPCAAAYHQAGPALSETPTLLSCVICVRLR